MSSQCLEVESYIQSKYYANPEKNFLYQLGVISCFSNLSTGPGAEDQGEVYYKMAVNEFDVPNALKTLLIKKSTA